MTNKRSTIQAKMQGYKLYSQELIDACWKSKYTSSRIRDSDKFGGFKTTRKMYDEDARSNFWAIEMHLLEKKFSKEKISEMEFVPLRPLGPNNDWVIPKGWSEYTFIDDDDDLCIWINNDSPYKPYIEMLSKKKLTSDVEKFMWKIYNQNPDDMIVFDCMTAEYCDPPTTS